LRSRAPLATPAAEQLYGQERVVPDPEKHRNDLEHDASEYQIDQGDERSEDDRPDNGQRTAGAQATDEEEEAAKQYENDKDRVNDLQESQRHERSESKIEKRCEKVLLLRIRCRHLYLKSLASAD
jgi:hypothetical protein